MARVRTANGFWVIVDGEDVGRVRGLRLGNVYIRVIEEKGGRVRYRMLHHVVLGIEKLGAGEVVDHINGNPLDCRKGNLRVCTKAQNAWNARVRLRSGRVRWRTYLKAGGVSWRKYYASEEEAVAAYNEKAREALGEFARLNVWRGPSRGYGKKQAAERGRHQK